LNAAQINTKNRSEKSREKINKYLKESHIEEIKELIKEGKEKMT
jgi:serine protease inhibitor